MADTYSTYEAKARFSEILRLVREGRTVTVSYHGEPVAEIRPIPGGTGLARRLDRLADRGVVRRPEPPAAGSAPRVPLRVARRAGALKRFLEDRGD